MKSVTAAIGLSTVYLVIFTILSQLSFDWSIRLVFFMFSLSPLPVIWLAWRILRDDYEYEGTFETRFYRDVAISSLPVGEESR